MGQTRANVLAPSGDFISYGSGQGGTDAQGQAELKALLLLVAGYGVTKVSQSSELLIADYPLGFAATQPTAFGHINMRRAGTGTEPPFVYRSRPVPYMSLSFKEAGSNLITTTGNAVADYITAYRDGEGLNGYIANAAKPSFFDMTS